MMEPQTRASIYHLLLFRFNETPQHVLLFDGEELKGAKQNRILNTTILIASSTSLDVPVSCTEQGRWSYQSDEFSSSGSLAHAELRKRKAASVAFSLDTQASHVSDQGAVREEIEKEIGVSIQWNNPKEGKYDISSHRIYDNPRDPKHREEIKAFMRDTLNRYVNTFRPRLSRLTEPDPGIQARG